MNNHLVRIACATSFAIALLGIANPASAAPVLPSYDTFGPCPSCDFGGTGIPNTSVAMDQSQVGQTQIFMALTAHKRYANPDVTDDGAGTFFAEAGGDMLNGAPDLAKWNFGFQATKTGLGSSLVYFQLGYDFDPGFGTDSSLMGWVTLPTSAENSWNLGMDFLQLYVPLLINPPSGSFDPNAAPGQYAFSLVAKHLLTHQVIDTVNILVNVNDPMQPVPEPTSMILLGSGLLFGAAKARRRLFPGDKEGTQAA